MSKSEQVLREYASFEHINQSEPIELLPLTITDMMEEYASEITTLCPDKFKRVDVVAPYIHPFDDEIKIFYKDLEIGSICRYLSISPVTQNKYLVSPKFKISGQTFVSDNENECENYLKTNFQIFINSILEQ